MLAWRSGCYWLSSRRRVVGLVTIFAFLSIVFYYTCLLVVFTDEWPIGHLNTGDSNNLVRGTRVALDCLHAGQLSDCGMAVGPYPLLQYLPAAVLVELGFADDQILGAFGAANFLALVLLLLAVLVTFRTRPKLGALLILMLLPTSLMYQATSAFSEALTASLVGAAVLAAVSRRPALLFTLVVAASLGKETLAPFVVVLALVCARSVTDGLLPSRKLTLASIGGGLVGLALGLVFNIFRFGTIRNIFYLDPRFRTPGVGRKIEFFAGIIASPSAGVVWFWPVLSLVTLLGAGMGVRRLMRRPHDLSNGLPVLVVLAVMLGWFASLALWFAPFGWEAYGPRLQVPVLVGGAVAIVHTAGESVVRFMQRQRVALAALAVSVAVGCIQFGAPWRWSNSMAELFGTPTGPCRESPVPVHPMVDSDLYYRCVSEMLWRRSPLVFDEVIDLSPSVAGLAWLLAAAGSLLLLWFVAGGDDLPGPSGGRSGSERIPFQAVLSRSD